MKFACGLMPRSHASTREHAEQQGRIASQREELGDSFNSAVADKS
jgi:hypothetical protein